MAITALERALMNFIRPMQLERRKAAASWQDVAFVNRSVGPTLDITFDKLDEYVPVERWRSGDPDLGQAEIVTDTGTIKAYFYGSEVLLSSWWENWLRENAVQTPNAALFENLGGERYNFARRMRRLSEEIERQIDNDFYVGHDRISFTGMLDLDTGATTLTNKIDTAAGRREFIDTLVALKSEAADEFQRGRVVLAIGEGDVPFLELPYDSTMPTVSARSFIDKLVDEVVPVQNTNMKKTAFLHWKDPENVEVLDMTPSGVQVVIGEPRRGEATRAKVFHMWTAHEYREKTVKEIAALRA